MDTKSKNYNENTDVAENLTAAQSPKQKARIAIPCLSWLSLIGGLSALAMVVMLCVMHMDLSDFYNAFASSVYETGDYGGRLKTLMWETAGQFDLLDDTMTASDAQYPQIIGECNLDNYYRYSSPRILYYNPQNGSAYATDSLDGNLTPERAAELYTAYSIAATETESVSILVYYNGPKEFHYLLNGYELTTDGDAGMYAVVNNYVGPNSNLYYNLFGDAGNGVYLFLVEVDDIPMLASLENTWRMNRLAVRIVIAVAVAAVVLALVGLCARRQRKAFVARIMQATSWFYSEVKVVAAFFAFVLFVTGLSESVWMGFPLSLQMFAVAIVCYWCLWYFLMDLIVHRKTYLTHSVICAVCYSAWKVFRRMMQGKPFQKQIMVRVLLFLLIELVLGFFISIFMFARYGWAFLFALFLAALAIALAVVFTLSIDNTLRDYSAVIDQIAAMHNGSAAAPLHLKETSLLYTTGVQLGDLQSGMKRTMEHMLRSERMKIELITNVSHDLKTPLTSIISYIDLLASMELTPEEANDYVTVVSQKAQRLHRMTNDLFDISKVESGNMHLQFEQIDMADHLRQTLAELDEKIAESSLDFKIAIPNEPVYIRADGEKLYRIFENLIVNALKYAMEHTRVYLSIRIADGEAVFEIKNIASYEMQFDADEITARFTRGDESRTEEGSGLGLAICKSFAQSFGGKFKVELDGDLFKATVSFPLYLELADPKQAPSM